MKNPFEIDADVNEDWDLGIDADSDEGYGLIINIHRLFFEKTKEAITYLGSLNENLRDRSEKMVVVDELMNEQREKSEQERELETLLPKAKEEMGIVIPKSLEETIALVQDSLLQIPPKDFDKISDYNDLIIGTYAHYLRRIAKYAWDIQNGKNN